jgi:hypothetical protein
LVKNAARMPWFHRSTGLSLTFEDLAGSHGGAGNHTITQSLISPLLPPQNGAFLSVRVLQGHMGKGTAARLDPNGAAVFRTMPQGSRAGMGNRRYVCVAIRPIHSVGHSVRQSSGFGMQAGMQALNYAA